MKVRKRYTVPKEQFDMFITEHYKEPLVITLSEDSYQVTVDTEMSEPEYNMSTLHLLADNTDITPEESNAIDYAIGAIKTLVDMGVLNDDKK